MKKKNFLSTFNTNCGPRAHIVFEYSAITVNIEVCELVLKFS